MGIHCTTFVHRFSDIVISLELPNLSEHATHVCRSRVIFSSNVGNFFQIWTHHNCNEMYAKAAMYFTMPLKLSNGETCMNYFRRYYNVIK